MSDDRATSGSDSDSDGIAPAESDGNGSAVLTLGDRDFLTRLRNSRPDWVLRYLWMLVAVAAVSAVGVWMFLRVRDLLSILLTSIFISFALEPAVNWLQSRGWRRGWATFLVFFAFVALVGVIVPLLARLVVSEGERLSSEIPGWISEFNDLLKRVGLDYKLEPSTITQHLSEASFSNVGSTLLGVVETAVGIVVRLFMILLFAVYFVVDGPRLRRTICSRLHADRQRRVMDLWEISIDKTGGYFYSRAVVAAAATAAMYLAMLLASFVPESNPDIRGAAIALALFYGLTDAFIPIIGAYIGLVLPVLITLISGDWVAALILLGVILVYKQIEDYWISPKVAARTMSVHPAIAIGSVFAGSELLGITGALIALPVAAIVQAFLSTYLERHELIDSRLVAETGAIPRNVGSPMRRWLPTRMRRNDADADEAAEPGGTSADG